MKKVLFFTVFTVCSLTILNAQENNDSSVDDIVEKAKNGGFYIGANIGVPLSGAGDLASFNFGADVAYLFGIIDDLEVGILVGYSHFLGDGTYRYYGDDGYVERNYNDASFVPVAASGRYYFNNRKFFAGADVGFAINVSGEAKSGFYGKGKFGYDLGPLTLIGSFSAITGGVDYDDNDYYGGLSVSGYHTANVGVEFTF